ncbi:MAG: hypothetical protein ACT4PI_01095 [Actinomycetota bacterium]
MPTTVEQHPSVNPPTTVVAAALLLGIQGALATWTGTRGPLHPGPSPRAGLAGHSGGGRATGARRRDLRGVTAVALARLRPWARVAAI